MAEREASSDDLSQYWIRLTPDGPLVFWDYRFGEQYGGALAAHVVAYIHARYYIVVLKQDDPERKQIMEEAIRKLAAIGIDIEELLRARESVE